MAYRKTALWAVIAATASSASMAMAQEAPAAEAGYGAASPEGDIIVTAQRREERLVDVPVSVSAVNTATLDRAQVRGVSDIGTVVPNIQINQTNGNSFRPLITIRGLSPSTDSSLARDQPVGLYLDGVVIGKATGAAFDTVDLERVEVLRGPQGTLYGKNTIGGAVNLITRRPSGEFGGQYLASAGSFGQFNQRLSVDLPEVAGFSVKVGVVTRLNDGYFRNSVSKKNFGEEELWAARADVLWRPSDSFSARYSYDISDSKGTPNQTATTAVTGVGPTAFVNALLQPFVVSGRTREIGSNSASGDNSRQANSNYRTTGHALTVEWEPGLGDLMLKSITARRTGVTQYAGDFDGSPVDAFFVILDNNYEQFTQEFQAIGTIGDFRYTLGAFYLDDKHYSFNPRWTFQFGGNAFDVSERGGGSTSYAGYGQFGWTPQALDERLTASIGVRYTRETKRSFERNLSNSAYRNNPAAPGSGVFVRDANGNPVTRSGQPAAGARPGAGGIGYTDLIPLENSGVWKKFNPEFNILYKIQPDFSVYGRVATGFKSGGINDTAATNGAFLTPYNPEKLTSFEVGVKYAGFDNALNLSAAVYHSIYKDFQASVLVPLLVTTNIVNAGGAEFTGFEVEGTLRPVDKLTINFGGGYVDARYTDFVLPNGTDVTKTYVFSRAPKWNFQIGALYRQDVGPGRLEANLNYSWRSSQFSDITGDPLPKLGSYGLLDGRLALTEIGLGGGTTGEIALWGKNLTNAAYKVTAINLSFLTLSQYGDPRSFGAEFRIRF